MVATPSHFTNGPSSPTAYDGFAVTPHDSTNFTLAARALYVGSDGNIALVTLGGTVLTFTNCKAGTVLPIACTRVNSTGTTVTGILGLY